MTTMPVRGVAPPDDAGRAMAADRVPSDFGECYAAWFGPIAGQLAVYLGSREEAQEVTQEAFTRAWSRWDRLARYDEPAAWVRKVAWNLATSRLRRARTAWQHWRTQRSELVDGPGPERVALERALAELPAAQRKALVLFYIAGLPTAEIAEICRASEGAVRNWLYRGRQALARELTDLEADDV